MRILAVGKRVELGDMYMSLLREGHEVHAAAWDPSHEGAFEGLVPKVADWRAELPWVGRDGMLLFERVGDGAVQEELRRDGYHVVGGSTLGDRLEYDRAYGQRVLQEAGLRLAETHGFATAAEAEAWLRANPGRFVLKYFNNARATFVGDHKAGLDVLFQLARGPQGPVLLMPHLDGVEVGVGAYFDGARFLRPACIDFEHKRFFNGERGEMTGEMGTLVAYPAENRIFEATLARLEPLFRDAGHVGYVNLNMIADERGLWPLEFTCRFGIPGFAILAPLQTAGWGDLFARMLARTETRFPASPDWCVGICLTIPPFPAEAPDARPEDDPPLFYQAEPEGDERAHYHHADIRCDGGQLFARRRTGYPMVVTGTGPTVAVAQADATRRARNVAAPNLRWRTDIGDRFLHGEGDRLRAMGWL